MDKNILKKFAIESRQELIEKISNKMKTYYPDEEFSKQQNGDIITLTNQKHTLKLSKEDDQKREILIKRVKELSITQVIEEAAYTWFNRIIAIRYMEIHHYLPLTKNNQSLGIRVLSSKDNTPDPEIMKFTNLTNPDLDLKLNKEKYISLKEENEKYKYLLLLICEKLGRVIPQVFNGITDYIDLLIPDNLLNETGFITKVIREVPEEYYNQVEIIGWLYQYYNQTEKDRVMSEKQAYQKNEIPYATQLFTPDWIVKYMVQNSLGRYWIEHSNSDSSTFDWKYYIKTNKKKSGEIISPEQLTFIDPCSGSGHILIYAFELLFQIYQSEGYSKNDIPELILKNNLYGLDIDNRAGQLSILAIILKAREYDKNIFNKSVLKNLNIFSIQEINQDLGNHYDQDLQETLQKVKDLFSNAKEYGSLIMPKKLELQKLKAQIEADNTIFGIEAKEKLLPIIKQCEILQKQYKVLVTNPPYLAYSSMSKQLRNFLVKHYPNSKADLFSCFVERSMTLTQKGGYFAQIMPPSILFLGAFEKIRRKLLEETSIMSLLHMGRGIFGVDFGSTAFVIKNEQVSNEKGAYFRLHERTFQMMLTQDIEQLFLATLNNKDLKFNFKNYNYNQVQNSLEKGGKQIYFEKYQKDFLDIPKTPIAYWSSEKLLQIFKEKQCIGSNCKVITGMTTADNEKFLRYWFEVDKNKINLTGKLNNQKWIPYQKGGDYRKWYGNNELVVNWEKDGYEIKHNIDEKTKKVRSSSYNDEYIFKPGITWSYISSAGFGVRDVNNQYHFDNKGSMIFTNEKDKNIYLGYLNSVLVKNILELYNPTMSFQPGDIIKIPFKEELLKMEEIKEIVIENIAIAKEEWDSKEISMDYNFILHSNSKLLKDAISDEILYWYQKKNKLRENEIILNEKILKNMGVYEEYKDELENIEITLQVPDTVDIVKKIISFYVGCLFGRFSIETKGLAEKEIKNQNVKELETSKQAVFIIDELYLNYDIVSGFKEFLEKLYSRENLNENLEFIAQTLGKKNGETNEETIRRYFTNDFYQEHVKLYQKKPIYWLFDSGKKNGFKCLTYMHKYNETTVSKIRLDYLHTLQNIYEKELKEIEEKLNTELTMNEKKKTLKRQMELNAKLQETKEYDEKIAHVASKKITINLDDGVTVNYAKFGYINPKTGKEESILAKIR